MQKPLSSGFGAASTTNEVIQGIDLTGKIAIVTGGYSGLGLETAKTFVTAGAVVIVPTRDPDKASTALAGIRNVEIEPMDLMDAASIDAFAERFLRSRRPVDILVNSGGIMATPLKRDARGYEAQFSTNHLGHFQLVAHLHPALRQAKGARVISVSSWAHHFSPVFFDDPNFDRRPYNPWTAYGQSKTANILFAVDLDRRARSEGVRAFALHPGTIMDTGLSRNFSPEEMRAVGLLDEYDNPILDPARSLKTVSQGAATIVWCATSPQLDGMGGVYCENCDIAPVESRKEKVDWTSEDSFEVLGVMPYAIDPEAAERLWRMSHQLLSPGTYEAL